MGEFVYRLDMLSTKHAAKKFSCDGTGFDVYNEPGFVSSTVEFLIADWTRR